MKIKEHFFKTAAAQKILWLFIAGLLAFGCNTQTKQEGTSSKMQMFVEDIDGNQYPTVQIGEQIWLASNLRTTQYADGEDISKNHGMSSLESPEIGSYTYYDNFTEHIETYGLLYNQYAVMERNLCPDGWRVPTDEDFHTLESFLGMAQEDLLATGLRGNTEGERLKSEMQKNWIINSSEKIENTGFNALPGGFMRPLSLEPYTDLGKAGYWWTSTSNARRTFLYRSLKHDSPKIERGGANEASFMSVRCVKERD